MLVSKCLWFVYSGRQATLDSEAEGSAVKHGRGRPGFSVWQLNLFLQPRWSPQHFCRAQCVMWAVVHRLASGPETAYVISFISQHPGSICMQCFSPSLNRSRTWAQLCKSTTLSCNNIGFVCDLNALQGENDCTFVFRISTIRPNQWWSISSMMNHSYTMHDCVWLRSRFCFAVS